MIWRVDCGVYQLFVIEDGHYWRSTDGYHPDAGDHDWRFHPRDEQGRVRMNFGCYVITDGEDTMMVDSGIGDEPVGSLGVVGGRMPAALDVLGIAAESVSKVVYTHMHYDHIGGSQRDGEVVLPAARHIFHSREWDHWRANDSPFGKAAQRIMGPLLDGSMVDFIDSDTEILPGVTTVEAFGHTPGHLMVSIVSEGRRILVTGDITNHPFHIEHPEWSLPVDNDPEMAAVERDRVFEQLLSSADPFAAPHYPMPGVGTVVNDNGLRVFNPLSVDRVGE